MSTQNPNLIVDHPELCESATYRSLTQVLFFYNVHLKHINGVSRRMALELEGNTTLEAFPLHVFV